MLLLKLFLCLVCAVTASYAYDSSTFYADNHLGQSVPAGRLPRLEKKKVQQDLLELMGLYSKPKPKANNKILASASRFMRDLYESIKGLDNLNPGQSPEDSHIHVSGLVNASALGLNPAKVEGSDVIVSFVNIARKKVHLRHEKDRTFYFDFSDVTVGENVRGADLRLYKEKADSPDLRNEGFTIKLYAIKQGPDWEDKLLELESSLPVSWNTEGWITLDATNIAEHWSLFPHMNMGLFMKVVDSKGKEYEPKDIGIVGRKGPAGKQAFLVGYMDVSPQILERRTRSIRTRRWSGSDMKSYSDNPYTDYARNGYVHYGNHNDCEKHNLYINFRDIGFDSEFLIAPEGYSAFYCAGDCSFPLGIHMNATNHAIVQTLVHLMNPEDVPKPCCAPTKFGTITLLYYDDNSSVKLKRFRNMIVHACGCH